LFDIKEKVLVVHNPIDRERVLELAKKPCPFTLSPPTVCAVGRLSWEKNFSMLIDAHANLISKGIPHQLCIVGEGPERKALEHKIEKLGVENSVSLLGFQENPYPYIARASFLAMPSVYEGFPTVVMEALVLGMPVVSSCAVTAEVFGGYNCGIITGPDQNSFEAGLEKILTDNVLHKKLCEAAVKRGNELDIREAVLRVEEVLAQ